MTVFDSICVPCILNQSLNAVNNSAPFDEGFKKSVLTEVCKKIINSKEGTTAPHLSAFVQKMISEYSGIDDPYSKAKRTNLRNTLKFEDSLYSYINNSENKLEMALRIAIAGNTIDLGANPNFNIQEEIDNLSSDNINLIAFPQFEEDVKKAKTVLYIADNLEEAVFDKFLLRHLQPKKIYFAVRSEPVLNDITYKDAIGLGIDKLSTVIESGSKIPGSDIDMCTEEFKDLFKSADIVIAKGQGNYETLLKRKRTVYFLFKVKCVAVAKRCGFEIGKSVIYKSNVN
jgi:damage-control phosphatase, subfamily I